MRSYFRFFLVIILVLGNFARASAVENELTFAVPKYSSEENFLDADTVTGYLLRSALTRTLFSYSSIRGDVQLDIASGYSVSIARSTIELALEKKNFFQDQNLITHSDILYSLQRCQSHGRLPGIDLSGMNREKKKITLPFRLSEYTVQSVLLSLSLCPILQERSSSIFGSHLATGTNFVSSGDFLIERFDDNRFVVLVRGVQPTEEASGLPLKIRISVEPDTEASLSSLRTGRYDAIFLKNQDVMARVKKDETLLAQKCSIYSVAMRKGLELPCASRIQFSQLGYHVSRNSTHLLEENHSSDT